MRTSAGFSRRNLLGSAAAGAMVAAIAPAARAAPFADECANGRRWPRARAPRAARIPHRIVQLGRRRDDPYSWIKFIPSQGQRELETMPRRIREHLRAEQRYEHAMLAPLEAARSEIAAAMAARVGPSQAVPSIRLGAWSYFSETRPDQGFPVYLRRAEGGAPEILVDENERARGHRYFRSTDHQHSPNHRFYAWAEDIIGDDRHRLLIRDNSTGAIRVAVEADAYGYGGLVFSPSSNWLFWIWRDERNRPTRLYRTAVENGETILVYEELDPAIFMQVRRTAEGGFVAITLSGPDTSEVRLISSADETAAPAIVWPRRVGVRYELEQWDGALALLTDADDAEDGKIVRLGVSGESAGDIVAHQQGRQILAMHAFGRGLVRLEREDGTLRLAISRPGGGEQIVSFGASPGSIELPEGQDYLSHACRVVYQAPNQPRQWFDVDLASGGKTLVAEETVPGFDPSRYTVQRLFAPAPDGELVPITVFFRSDAPRDGSAPLLLYGYGAYGISSDPEFSIPNTVLVDRGWRYAIAHVRGGSERGRRWFLEGRTLNKRNSFTDFIACAEFLQREGYADAGKTVAYGLSAGGLLVGASMTIRPDLWAGIIAKVPFVDMLNTMSDASHPLVPLFRPDWGDPLADPAAYDYIASISPYENVRPAAYPPLLCTAGLKDDRVGYWEPAKFVAEVRHRTLSENPAILKLSADSGHQGSGSEADAFSEYALFWSFAERCVAPARACRAEHE